MVTSNTKALFKNVTICNYSILPNRRVYMFISGQVCLLGSIKVKRQTWPEINVYTRLFGSIEYIHIT